MIRIPSPAGLELLLMQVLEEGAATLRETEGRSSTPRMQSW